ncbi:MAG: M48 family metalloprotease [Planctomycetes bacterium]|nr:M48 family metalloprotease [Planctomycetota bacterium]
MSVAARAMAAAVLPLATWTAGCSTNPVTGKRELILIPESQEIAMGVEAAPQFEKRFGGRVPNEILQDYVRRIGRKIAAVSDRPDMPYDYTLVRSGVPNAFALPGGKVFLTAGLMARMSDERQLAAVLGHETGHVCAKHNIKGMQRQMGTALLLEVAGRTTDMDNDAKSIAKVVATMVNLKYSRNDEYQADELGMKYMTKAGYNPYGMVELLEVLLRLNDSEPGSLAEMFQTHPLSSKRIARARRIIQDRYARYKPDSPDPHQNRFLRMRALLLKSVPALGAGTAARSHRDHRAPSPRRTRRATGRPGWNDKLDPARRADRQDALARARRPGR